MSRPVMGLLYLLLYCPYIRNIASQHASSRQRQVTDLKVTAELWDILVEFALRHSCGAQNLDLAPRVLGKFV
jgi:hypothetical protein